MASCVLPWEYVLAGRIELDEGYFSTEIPKEEKDKPLKRGRGSQKKSKVLVRGCLNFFFRWFDNVYLRI